jgi:hypothetical protein
MKESISKIKRYNLQVITVTQDLSDLKNASGDTVSAIVENCTAYICQGNYDNLSLLRSHQSFGGNHVK